MRSFTVHVFDPDGVAVSGIGKAVSELSGSLELHSSMEDGDDSKLVSAGPLSEGDCCAIVCASPAHSTQRVTDMLERIATICETRNDVPILLATSDNGHLPRVRISRLRLFAITPVNTSKDDWKKLIHESLAVSRFCEEYKHRVAIAERSFACLTIRQRLIVDMLMQGRQNKFIANQLQLSKRTVELDRAAILSAMNAENAIHLASLVTEMRMIQARRCEPDSSLTDDSIQRIDAGEDPVLSPVLRTPVEQGLDERNMTV